MTRTLVITCGLLVTACADDEESETLQQRFLSRPVRVVASDDLPAPCALALYDATSFFRAHGVTMLLSMADAETTPVLNGLAEPGVIAVLPDGLPMSPGQIAHGETRRALTVLENILGAEVSLASCDERVVAHELGHALGLEHVHVKGNLMHAELGFGGWELTPEQAAWIADVR